MKIFYFLNFIRSDVPLLRRHFSRLLLVASFIAAEFFLQYFCIDGLSQSPSELTFRGYLNQYGPSQFFPAIYSTAVFKKAFYTFVLGLFALYVSQWRKPYFVDSFFEGRVGINSVSINLISFSALLG